MKTCTYCGKEHPDDATQCAIDGHPLSGGAAEPAAAATPPDSGASQLEEAAERIWTERELRIFELILICVVAEGGSMINSIYEFWNHVIGRSVMFSTPIVILSASVRQIATLALLWYVLKRRTKSFSDIGFHNCTWWDFGWSLPIYLGHILISFGFHLVFKHSWVEFKPVSRRDIHGESFHKLDYPGCLRVPGCVFRGAHRASLPDD